MLDIITVSFLASALGFVVAYAWNSLATAMLLKYEKKDLETGEPVNMVNQLFLYAISVTLFSVLLVYFLHSFKIVDITKISK